MFTKVVAWYKDRINQKCVTPLELTYWVVISMSVMGFNSIDFSFTNWLVLGLLFVVGTTITALAIGPIYLTATAWIYSTGEKDE